MTAVALSSLVLVIVVLAAVGFGPSLLARWRKRGARVVTRRRRELLALQDPGRELRAERRARELLRSVAGAHAYAMYRELGFVRVLRRERHDGPARYGYLLYPHRPIVAYDAATGELLSEYCVGFPDRTEAEAASRLPDADDVLAKWMALHGDEHGLIADANMHLPGRQLDPTHVRRDLRRVAEWEARRARQAPRRAGEAVERGSARGEPADGGLAAEIAA